MNLSDYKSTTYTVPTAGSATWVIAAETYNSASKTREIILTDKWDETQLALTATKETARLLADIFADIANEFEGAN